MAREFTMGARITLEASKFKNGMAAAIQTTTNFAKATMGTDKQLGKSSSNMTEAANKTKASVERLDSSMDGLAAGAGKAGAAQRKFAASTDNATREMNEQSREATSLKDKLFSLQGAAAAFLGGAAVKGAFDFLVAGNADLEQYKNTLTTVLKSEKKAVETLEWANKFAAQTPFEIPQIIEATTVMSSYGMVAQDSMGLIGDMASVMGKDLMQAVEAVADANTGELERLKEFGITKKMITEQAELMGKQVFDKKGSMKDQAAFNEVLFKMMEDRFKGGMAMQATTFKGMLSNAQDYIGTIGRTLGQPIFDKMKDGLGSVLAWADKLKSSGKLEEWIAGVQKGFGKLGYAVAFIRYDVIGAILEIFNDFIDRNKTNLAVIGGALKGAFVNLKTAAGPVFDWLVFTALPAVLRAMRDVGGVVVNLATSFIENFSKFKPYIIGIAAAFLTYKAALIAINTYTKIVAAAQLAFNAVMAMNPYILLVIGIGLLIGYIIKLAGGWDVVKVKLLAFWEVIKSTFNSIKTAAMPILALLQAGLMKVWQVALPYIQQAVAYLKNLIVTWAQNIWATVGPLLTILKTGIMNVFNAVKSFLDVWGSTILVVLSLYWTLAVSLFKSALTIIWAVVEGAFKYIYNIISGIFKIIIGVIEVGWALISGIFSVALNLLSGDWKGAWDAMLGMLDGVWEGIKTFFSGLKDLFFDSGKAIIMTLVDGITAAASAPVKAIKSVLSKVRDLLPFSDAKKGPLSNLTLNGGKIVTTMAEGVYKQQGALSGAMGDVLDRTPLAASGSYAVDGQVNPAGGARAGKAGGAGVVIQKLVETITITGADGKNAKQLADEIIQELFERFENADEILSAAGLGDLLND